MKQTFYFIRSAPYEYLVDKQNLYVSFDLLARNKTDPDLKEDSKKFIKESLPSKILNLKTYYDSTKRSKQTAKIISKNIKKLLLLSEIKYTMLDILSEKDFYAKVKPDVKAARVKFVKALISDKLEEEYSSVISRVEEIILNTEFDEPKAVFISHGFFLKVIEAFIRDPSIKNDPEKLLKYFSGETETFKFCEGFVAEYDKKLIFKKYLRNNRRSNI